MSKTLNTINGETLMNTFIPPVEFVVKDLIAQGGLPADEKSRYRQCGKAVRPVSP